MAETKYPDEEILIMTTIKKNSAKIEELENRITNLERALIKVAADYVSLAGVTYQGMARFNEFVKMFETMVAAAQMPKIPKEKMN